MCRCWCAVEKPSSLDFTSVRKTLMHIVPLCLDSDPSLIPLSCKQDRDEDTTPEDGRDPDDFRFWSERQAKRISLAIEQAFDVEHSRIVSGETAPMGTQKCTPVTDIRTSQS